MPALAEETSSPTAEEAEARMLGNTPSVGIWGLQRAYAWG